MTKIDSKMINHQGRDKYVQKSLMSSSDLLKASLEEA